MAFNYVAYNFIFKEILKKNGFHNVNRFINDR